MIYLENDFLGSAGRVLSEEFGGAVELIGDGPGLEGLREEWRALSSTADRSSACADHAWVIEWWNAFGKRPEGAGEHTALFVLAVRSASGELVGVVPMYETVPANGTRLRRLEPIGELSPERGFGMTEEPSVLVRKGWEVYVVDAAVKAFRAGLQSGRWDVVRFRKWSDPDVPAPFGTLQSLAWVRSDFRSGSDYADLPESWAEVRKSLSKSMRDNLGYYPRLLNRDGHDWRVRYVSDPALIEGAAERLTHLHRARANSLKGTLHCNHIDGPSQATFLKGLLLRLAAEGRAFVAELVIGGEVVASQAFIENGGDLTVFYSGYLEDWSRYSPIFVIDAVVFQDAVERGTRRIDFLRNSAQWKTRWGAETGPPLSRSTLVSRRPEACLRYAAYLAGTEFRRHVVDRLPVYVRRLRRRIEPIRALVERAWARCVHSVLPAAPVLGRLALRGAPNVHLALRLAPLHHR